MRGLPSNCYGTGPYLKYYYGLVLLSFVVTVARHIHKSYSRP